MAGNKSLKPIIIPSRDAVETAIERSKDGRSATWEEIGRKIPPHIGQWENTDKAKKKVARDNL